MKEKELIKQCRYYKGEKECPFSASDIAAFWQAERTFVESNGRFVGEGELYQNIGGKEFPGIPNPILFSLFTMWAKFVTFKKEELPNFYKMVDSYLDFVSERIPKDKIPG